MNDGFLQFLGIAWRARAVVAGEYPCLRALRAGKGILLVVAQDASENTADRLISAANYRSVPCLKLYSKMELGLALGHSQRAALLITDEKIALKLQELAQRV